jgi:hypothetical protein
MLLQVKSPLGLYTGRNINQPRGRNLYGNVGAVRQLMRACESSAWRIPPTPAGEAGGQETSYARLSRLGGLIASNDEHTAQAVRASADAI